MATANRSVADKNENDTEREIFILGISLRNLCGYDPAEDLLWQAAGTRAATYRIWSAATDLSDSEYLHFQIEFRSR